MLTIWKFWAKVIEGVEAGKEEKKILEWEVREGARQVSDGPGKAIKEVKACSLQSGKGGAGAEVIAVSYRLTPYTLLESKVKSPLKNTWYSSEPLAIHRAPHFSHFQQTITWKFKWFSFSERDPEVGVASAVNVKKRGTIQTWFWFGLFNLWLLILLCQIRSSLEYIYIFFF